MALAPAAQCKALYAFEAASDDQLSLTEGEVVELSQKDSNGWWLVKKGDKVGWAPTSYLQEIAQANPLAPPLPVAAPALTSLTGALVAPGSAGPIGLPERPGQATSATSAVDFSSPEEATKAFMGLLRSAGVTPAWTWEQTMRNIVTDPLYKALRTLAERRSAFERYIDDYRKRERETRERNLERIRPAWREGLGRATEGEGGMKSWWSWERSRQALSEGLPEMWRMARDDDERRILWDEYVSDLKRKEELREREVRQNNVDKLQKLLAKLSLDVGTTWSAARRALERSNDWLGDAELQQIAPADMLTAFEDVVRDLERHANEERQRAKEERRRRARKARQAFIALLHELRLDKRLTTGTHWKDVFPLIESDERYRKILGQPGSSPIDLFWDVVDEMDAKCEDDRHSLQAAITNVGLLFTELTTFPAFDEALHNDAVYQAMPADRRRGVYDLLHKTATRTAKQERRQAERTLRTQMDDLRHALRKIEPAIGPETSYEQALPSFSHLAEYTAIADEDARQTAFRKYTQRLRDKIRERDVSDSGSRAGTPQSSSRRREGADFLRSEDNPDRSGSRAPRHRSGEAHRTASKRERDHGREPDNADRAAERRSTKRRADDMEEGEVHGT